MTIHRIKLNDLDGHFLKKLQTEHANQQVELEIRVHQLENATTSLAMNEEEFWKIIELLDWEKTGDDEAVLLPAVDYLSQLEVEAIKKFQDILSEKLYHLDGQKYAEQTGENAYTEKGSFSVDVFLYTRCCVVANGKEYYEHVLENPKDMPKDLTFESLLYLANEAYFKKTKEKLSYVPAYNFETFFNLEGWNLTTARL
jgi:hypothetical protein